ncbi:hypothetical protein [Nonomuraea antimicrobica]
MSTWPRWVPGAATGWGLGLVVLTLSWALGSEHGRPLPSFDLPGPFWWTLVVLAVATTVAARGGPSVLWPAVAVPVLGTFGLVMQAVAALATGRVEDWPALLVSLYCVAGATLFTGAALVRTRTARGACARCGYAHPGGPVTGRTYPEPGRASFAVRWTAYLGAVAFVPYIVMKTVWALGLPIAGVAGPDLTVGSGAGSVLGRLGIDLTSVLALAGAVLSVALVHRWGQVFPRWVPVLGGRRVPRWIPLVPAWLGATSLGLYPFVALALLVSGAEPAASGGIGAWVVVVGLAGFGGWGVSVGVAAVSYQRRTRPQCGPPPVSDVLHRPMQNS